MKVVKTFLSVLGLLTLPMLIQVMGQTVESADGIAQPNLACAADFIADKTEICIGDTVTFTSTSTGTITDYNWRFQGGDPSSETGKGPHQVVYNTAGMFYVSLGVSSPNCKDAKTIENYITVNKCPCTADFSADVRSGCAPLKVIFTNKSSNAATWSWNFPGGSPSSATGAGPHEVTYNSSGDYYVSLYIKCKDNSTDTEARSKYISVQDCGAEFDFGDSPDPTYPTLLASNGARHRINQDWYLGTSIDGEQDGQPSATAQGDDSQNLDDEDGVVFTSLLTPGLSASVSVQASRDGFLHAWMDFNSDGDWADAGEEIISAFHVVNGWNAISFPVPAGAIIKATFARFRFSNNQSLSYTGEASEGEVEDYQVIIGPDGPQPGSMSLKFAVCMELDMQDPTGKVEHLVLNGSATAIANIDASGVAADTDGDGLDQVPSTIISLDFPQVSSGWGLLQFSLYPLIPSVGDIEEQANATAGILDIPPFTAAGTARCGYAVFLQFETIATGIYYHTQEPVKMTSLITNLPPVLANLEVVAGSPSLEIYDSSNQLTGFKLTNIQNCTGTQGGNDFGDAPASYQVATPSSFCINPDIKLGKLVDSEAGPLSSVHANKDDLDNLDDEDGITFLTQLIPGQVASLLLDLSQTKFGGFQVTGMIDFNANGKWDTPQEVIFDNPYPPAAIHMIVFNVPATAVIGTTFARFYIAGQFDFAPVGTHGCLWGEVEDYEVIIGKDGPQPDVMIIKYPTCTEMDMKLPNGGLEHVVLNGGAIAQVDINNSGTASDTDGDGRDQVPCKLVVLVLNGVCSMGPVKIELDPSAIQSGEVEELVNNTPGILDIPPFKPVGSAQIYYNTWVKLDIGGTPLFGAVAIRFEDIISSLPPVPPILTPAPGMPPITLFDSNGNPSGISIYDFKACPPTEGRYDFGDAPDPTYPTLMVNSGAAHLINEKMYLGSKIDAEPDGQPNATATGDDLAGANDEDGVTGAPLLPGNPCTIQVVASLPGALNAWIDYNRDGDWDESDEHVIAGMPVVAGNNTITFNVPATAAPGTTFARVRYSTQQQLSYTGIARDGEVEDYEVKIEGKEEYDWGDLPAPYRTLHAANGAYHIVDQNYKLGNLLDAEQDGQPSADATGDDANNLDDEDGVNISTVSNTAVQLDFPSFNGGQVALWIDIDNDGDFLDLGGSMRAYFNGVSAPVSVAFFSGLGFPIGKHYARIRLYKDPMNPPVPDGFGGIGEVEDYQFEFIKKEVAYDYGDAPDPYPTKLTPTSDGGRHPIVQGVYLGNGVDPEADGQPDAGALGDDNNGTDDEDGLISISPMVPGCIAMCEISASTQGFLSCWIDFNNNGDWTDTDDNVFLNLPVTPGSNIISYLVPITASGGATFMRLRFSTHQLAFDPVNKIYIALDGEVEDHVVKIYRPKTSVIGDRVWIDGNKNGIQDAGEPGLANVSVELYNSGGTHLATTITNPAGFYYFADLLTGDYFVKFLLPVGLAFTIPDFGPDDTIDSDANPATGQTSVFTLPPGTVDLTRDAGLVRSTQEGIYDFGDVPDPTYPTLLINNGARHKIIPTMFLGTTIDPELDGQPTANALGDDLDGIDDDDGVVFPPVWQIGAMINIQVIAAGVPVGTAAFLNGWVDYNGDGDWVDPGEQFIIARPLVNGANVVAVLVPPTATPGFTYARFRYSTVQNLGYKDEAPNGEVEDYQIYLGDKLKNLVGDLVWYDTNTNGILDVGEIGIPGVKVNLHQAGGLLVGTTTTNVFGLYVFFNLPAGQYYLKFELPPDHVFSPQDQGIDDLLDSDPDPSTSKTADFTVGVSTFDISRDAGMHKKELQDTFDFGDAPDPTYPTLHASGGAYHIIVPGFQLGAAVDADADGHPDANALGDDNTGVDDEDGVVFTSPLNLGSFASISVTASQPGVLNAWLDFNLDGDWADANEHIIIDKNLNAGMNILTFFVPFTASKGSTFARFRFCKDAGLTFAGMAKSGEVEDYQVMITEGQGKYNFKWHQYPLKSRLSPYPECFYGWDEWTTMGMSTVADDWFCDDPRPVTGIQWWGSYKGWQEKQAPPTGPTAFHIGVWTDVPAGANQPFSHPGKLIWEWKVDRELANERVSGGDFMPGMMEKPDSCFRYDFIIPPAEWFYQEGDSTVYWLSIAAIYKDLPSQYTWGWKTREHYFNDNAVRITKPTNLTVGVNWETGETLPAFWDMAFVLTTNERTTVFDFGDAPDPLYPTLLLSNGAHHIYDPLVYLGSTVDTEIDGLPHISSLGDDLDASDDEDGVRFVTSLSPGLTAKVQVFASTAGYLNAWIDFNGNGYWGDANDQIFSDQILAAGLNTLEFTVPSSTSVYDTYARFRFSTVKGLYWVGCAIDGEVEDYMVQILASDVIESQQEIPKDYELSQNYPNPFNPYTDIVYSLPRPGRVQLVIYDLMGREIRVLVDGSRDTGRHTVTWDARDDKGSTMPSGIYIYRIIAGKYVQSKKMLLLK